MNGFKQFINKNFWNLSSKETTSGKFPVSEKTTDASPYLGQIGVSYHHKESQGLVEPQTGWFLKGRKIIAESYPYWTNVTSGWPPMPSIKGYLNPFKKVRVVKEVVSFHYGWDNYYHFFVDLLPALMHWKNVGNPNIPVLVPKKMGKSPFVEEFLTLTNLVESHSVIYQEQDEYIKVSGEAHFIKRSRFGSSELKEVIEMLKSQTAFGTGNRKVFLTRSGYRYLTNRDEIESIAKDAQFEIIDTAHMSLVSQINLFSEVRYFVGIHGAGLTNMIWRKDQDLSLLEIFPKNKIPCHYWHLTLDFGFNYNYCIGSEMGKQEEFYLNPEVFKQTLMRMLSEDPNETL